MGPRVLVTHASRSVVLISNEVSSLLYRRSQLEKATPPSLSLSIPSLSLSSLKIQQEARACIFRVNRARRWASQSVSWTLALEASLKGESSSSFTTTSSPKPPRISDRFAPATKASAPTPPSLSTTRSLSLSLL